MSDTSKMRFKTGEMVHDDGASAPELPENEDLLERLTSTGTQLGLDAVEEIKNLRKELVRARLDRDNWRRDYENEKELCGELYDVASGKLDDSSLNIERAVRALDRYEKKYRGNGRLGDN